MQSHILGTIRSSNYTLFRRLLRLLELVHTRSRLIWCCVDPTLQNPSTFFGLIYRTHVPWPFFFFGLDWKIKNKRKHLDQTSPCLCLGCRTCLESPRWERAAELLIESKPWRISPFNTPSVDVCWLTWWCIDLTGKIYNFNPNF